MQFMVEDILHRLGVTEMMVEQDKDTLSRMQNDAQRAQDVRDQAFVKMIDNLPDKATAEFARCAAMIFTYSSIPHKSTYSVDDHTFQDNAFLVMIPGKDAGMHMHAADPMHEQKSAAIDAAQAKEKSEDITLEDRFEAPMSKAIAGVAAQQNAFGFFGAGHVPGLVDRLKDGDAHVVGIDCTAGVHLRNFTMGPVTRGRMDRLAELYVPDIKSRVHTSPDHAPAMTLRASVKHMRLYDELGIVDAAERNAILDEITSRKMRSAER